MFRTFTTAAILALTIAAAQAGDSITVRVGDLDLAKASDTQVLAGRVHEAAASVCTTEIQDRYPVSLYYRFERDACIANVSQTLSQKVLAKFGHSRTLATN